jgi:glycosyltransferase involved in cell wall biosynthesis
MEKSKKKILFLITKSNFGGAQRYVHDLAVGLPKNRFEVAVALGGNGPLVGKLAMADIRVITIPSLQRDVSIGKELAAFGEISAIVKNEQPDILHINSSKAGALGALIGRLHKVTKVIFTAHGWAFNEERPTWQRFVLKFIHWLTVLLSHQTIAVSEEVKRQLDWPGAQSKMTVIYNGRTLDGLKDRGVARTALIEKKPLLERYGEDLWSVTIAELHPIKRHEAVIKAMKEVARLSPRYRHLIIGGGQEEDHLRHLIKDNELEEHVFLLGNIEDAAEYLKAADIFILASRSEAMPYAIIEACIAGLPIIATAVGGIPEVIENEVSGILIPPLDDNALAKAIVRLSTDPALQQRLSAGALTSSLRFRFADTLQKTIDLYLSA